MTGGGGPQLAPVTSDGAAIMQAVAEEADEAVRDVLKRLAAKHPGKLGAVMSGALAALIRIEFQAMPEETQAFQIAERINPRVLQIAMRVVEAKKRGAADA